jgi:hypothetical protein
LRRIPTKTAFSPSFRRALTYFVERLGDWTGTL